MAKHSKRAAWGVVLVVLAYEGSRFLFGARISERKVDETIKNHLPIGADETEVLRFLDARGWAHSGVVITAAFDSGFDREQIEYGAAQVIHARVQNVGSGWADLGLLQLGFAFNKHGKLTRHRVEQIGPDVP